MCLMTHFIVSQVRFLQSSKVEKERRVRMAMLAWLNMNVYWLEMANFKI